MPASYTSARMLLMAVSLAAGAVPAEAQNCTRRGSDVTCDDGRHGIFEGDAILWPDGTHSRPGPNPSVIIGNKSAVVVGKGVFVGQDKGNGNGMVPLEDPNAPNKTRCAILDGTSYCY